MWIVRVALDRPYTFIVLALLILIASPVVIARTPTAALKRATEEAATATVLVVHPTASDATDELVLPGNAREFTDAPSTRGPAVISRS
jgi:hypothetical protein